MSAKLKCSSSPQSGVFVTPLKASTQSETETLDQAANTAPQNKSDSTTYPSNQSSSRKKLKHMNIHRIKASIISKFSGDDSNKVETHEAAGLEHESSVSDREKIKIPPDTIIGKSSPDLQEEIDDPFEIN